jgi:predicted DCC family thiol-disulfide oxidoreductase YuxK
VNDSRAQRASETGRHLILYDGVCGLCNRLLQFVIARDDGAIFRFAPLQSPFGRETVARFGGSDVSPGTFYLIADYRTAYAHALTQSGGVLFILRELGWPWKLAGVVRIVPRALRDRAYDLVARHRYRIFGRLDACLVPSPEVRARFID